MLRKGLLFICLSMAMVVSSTAYAKEQPKPKLSSDIQVPKSVIDISKENTYSNPTQDEPQLQPSQLTKALLKTAKTTIKNPTLIKLLNESNIHTSKLSLGYHASIYLGKWPLNYQSDKTAVNWEYKKINDNDVDARGSKETQNLTYNQTNQTIVNGGLTAKVPSEKEVKKLMLMEAMKHTSLPIAFSTIVGQGTKLDRMYHVEPNKVGHLTGYIPAVNEKGKITYGEVYLVLDGGNKRLDVKNLTQQGIGAWMPIQDHLSLRYFATN